MGSPVCCTDAGSVWGRVDPPPYTDSDRPKGRVRGSDPPPLPVAYTDSSQRLGREGPDPPLPLHGRYCAQREGRHGERDTLHAPYGSVHRNASAVENRSKPFTYCALALM